MSNVDSQKLAFTRGKVVPHLHSATAKIEVREINGGSGDALNYFDHKDGLSVIAVGGDKLSRGVDFGRLVGKLLFACIQNVRYLNANGALVWLSPRVR